MNPAARRGDEERVIVDIEQDAVILLGHGSRDRSAMEESNRFLTYFRRWSGLKTVGQGYLELASPSIPEAIDQAVLKGARRVWALPLFLFPGRHVENDLPRLLSEARRRHPEVVFHLGAPLSRHPKLLELAKRRIESLPDAGDPRKRALLTVSRGSRSPEGAAAAAAWAGRLERLFPCRSAVHAFADVVSPTLSEAAFRSVEGGARSLIVFPALLFPGSVLQSIHAQIGAVRERHPDCAVRIAEPFGADPPLAEIVWEGVKQAGPLAPEGAPQKPREQRR